MSTSCSNTQPKSLSKCQDCLINELLRQIVKYRQQGSLQFGNDLFTLKNAHLSSNSYNSWTQPNIVIKFAGYMALIFLYKSCEFGEKICNNSRDIEFFLGDHYFLVRPVQSLREMRKPYNMHDMEIPPGNSPQEMSRWNTALPPARGALWAPPVGSGAKPWPLLILVLFELRRTRGETTIIAAFRGARAGSAPL